MPDLLLVAASAQRQGEAWHGMGGVQLGAGPLIPVDQDIVRRRRVADGAGGFLLIERISTASLRTVARC